MGETANTVEKAPKKSWFKGLKSEFKKIIWPTQDALVKQTTAVIVATFIIGVMVYIMDTVIGYGVNLLIK